MTRRARVRCAIGALVALMGATVALLAPTNGCGQPVAPGLRGVLLRPILSKHFVGRRCAVTIELPQWAFDGKSIVFERRVVDRRDYLVIGGAPVIGGGAGNTTERAEAHEIMRLDVEARALSRLAEGLAPRVSGTGPIVVYRAAKPATNTQELWVHNWQTGQRAKCCDDGRVREMSPDGHSMLFSKRQGLYYASLSDPGAAVPLSAQLLPLRKTGRDDIQYRWTKDSRLYAVVSPAGEASKWFTVRGRPPKLEPIPPERVPAESAFWRGSSHVSPQRGIPSPDGRRTVRVKRAEESVTAGQVKKTPVIITTLIDNLFLVQPDGAEEQLTHFQAPEP